MATMLYLYTLVMSTSEMSCNDQDADNFADADADADPRVGLLHDDVMISEIIRIRVAQESARKEILALSLKMCDRSIESKATLTALTTRLDALAVKLDTHTVNMRSYNERTSATLAPIAEKYKRDLRNDRISTCITIAVAVAFVVCAGIAKVV
jgi:hypothetical protein